MHSAILFGTMVERAKTGAIEGERIYPCYTPLPDSPVWSGGRAKPQVEAVKP